MQVDSYAYLPANTKHSLISDELTTLVIFERRYNNLIEMLQFTDVVLYQFDCLLPLLLASLLQYVEVHMPVRCILIFKIGLCWLVEMVEL